MTAIRNRGDAVRILMLATSLLVSGGCSAAAELGDIGTVENVKARFNRDAGKPRLLLLLSPT